MLSAEQMHDMLLAQLYEASLKAADAEEDIKEKINILREAANAFSFAKGKKG